MSPGHDDVRRLLGGYVLGGLGDDEQFRVDAHLSTCAECRDEVNRLAPVPELLHRLPADPAAQPLEQPTPAGLEALLRRARPRRLPVGVLAGVAAAVVALVLITALALRDSGPQTVPPPQAAASPSASASAGTVVQFVAAQGSGLAGRATLTPRQWGVSVALEVTGLPGDGPFVLQVVGRGGQSEQAACWGPTTSTSARVTGASSIQLGNVDAVRVADHHGVLLGEARTT
ncbi:zf-HC2 domain-containing protein [Dactylosporangium sp. AC04546]|uniref:zf-HC2 domain-containing protein n=1 Tax=Dactylosporangium sp. AC04546 TaxID=2862460 RepID=UPI001EDCCF7A|nr:zf-HC2 domain-containing protein [Dactylosporangium sp. AC04546]WVK81968.1 zf-HC2 domain-containing protein [Dactylosporangium sp. AC04546]